MQFYFEGLLKTQDKILDLKAKIDTDKTLNTDSQS